LKYGNHFLTPLWSVGVEEMYYLGWAPIVKWFRKRLVFILAGTVIFKTVLAISVHYGSGDAIVAEALRMLQFEAMAIGGLAAFLVFYRAQPLSRHWLFSRPAQCVLVSLLLLRIVFHGAATESLPPYAALFDHPVFTPFVLMVVFAWFIVNVAVNERNIFHLDWRPLNYLGDVSYGIYMYHGLAISLLFVPLRDKYQDVGFLPATLLLHLLVATFTLLFAAASKAFFEDKFLRFKRRLENLPDGSEYVVNGQQPTPILVRDLAV
jgi:peptidoglycan/LPS O-acetylase OafA/YrhL